MSFLYINDVRLIYTLLRIPCCFITKSLWLLRTTCIIVTITMWISLRHPCIFGYRYFWCYESPVFSKEVNVSRDELTRSQLSIIWFSLHDQKPLDHNFIKINYILTRTNIETEYFSLFLSTGKFDWSASVPLLQKFVDKTGKHTACGEQHELTIQTEVFDAQVYVILSHGSKIEHRIPGAQ